MYETLVAPVRCLLLPPAGLWWSLKYLKEKDNKSKLVGLVCITITILVIVITVKTIQVNNIGL